MNEIIAGGNVNNRKGVVERLQKSLDQQSAMPNLGYWLASLDTNDVLSLALMALEGRNTRAVTSMTRVLLVAEGLYRPRLNNEEKYLAKLGWYALAEYAFRMEWALISNNPTLTVDARETTTITPLGHIMMSALGPSSRAAYWLSSWLKTDHLN
jgi:hypothetical protein